MAFIRLQVTMPHVSGVDADAVMWTTHWQSRTGSESALAVAVSAVTQWSNFLNDVNFYFSNQYSQAGIYAESFSLLDPPPRLPILVSGPPIGTPTTGTTNDLPAELAICVSFQGAPSSGLNQRRRRGRFYLGPLSFNASTSPDIPLVATSVVDTIAAAGWDNLVNAGGDAQFSVYSSYTAKDIPVGGTPGEGDVEQPELIPGAFTAVNQLWVDNAWDIQRRRGLQATYRKSYS